MDQRKKWLSVICIACVLILLICGFIFGYAYNDKKNNSCTNNPFIYGIKEVNEDNGANFICSCGAERGLNFYFNDEVLENGNYYGGFE